MIRKFALFFVLFQCIALAAAGLDFKGSAEVVRLKDFDFQKLSVKPHFAAAEICTVRHDVGVYYAILHWVTGAELYKSYQDPGLACDGPYPFSVEEIHMIMYFETLCTLNVSVDIEAADLSDPSCPVPGELLALSSEYMYVIPGEGLYQIPVPLDTPYVVNEPYFAGYYISNVIDSNVGAAVITDSIPYLCMGYNIWDTAIGFIDLVDNDYFDFPGQILLFSTGMPGGSGGTAPAPIVDILEPSSGELVVGPLTIWAAETAGNNIIDYVKFARKTTGVWTEIGSDYDPSRALRNGVDPSGSGDGLTFDWNYSSLEENSYWLKATIYDTLGQTAVDSLQVSIDPTPPNLTFSGLSHGDTICLPLTLQVTSPDQDINEVIFEKKSASVNHSAAVTTLNQSKFGSYYCGPVAAAIAIKYWFDKGFIYGMREGSKYISIDTVVTRFASLMQTNQNNGTYDDLFYRGFQQYVANHGNELFIEHYRRPDYWLFRTLFQERETAVILALSGNPGVYLVASGITGLADSEGRFAIAVSDPTTGTIVNCYMKNAGDGAQVYYKNAWHDLDMIFAIWGYSFQPTRELIGTDASSDGGWTVEWSGSDLASDSLYFVTASATDGSGRTGVAGVLTRYLCEQYLPGDYNADGEFNVADLVLLINFVFRDGSAPVGGTHRADADCNGDIDLSDVIVVIRHFYLHAPAPCY
jgi:hypothetical protein